MNIGDKVSFDGKEYIILEIKPRPRVANVTLLGNIVTIQNVNDPTDKTQVFDFDL